MRFLAVVNPAAGGGRCGKEYPAAIKRLEDAGIEVEVVTTSGPGQASELVRDAWAKGQRRFLAVGGDGTGYELVNGMFPAALEGETPQLGFLPLGTGNSFLRDFMSTGDKDGAGHALGALLELRTRKIDVVRIEHDNGENFYINLFAIGFAADVNSRAARYKNWGEFGYIGSVIAETLGLAPRSYPLREDGGEWNRDPAAFIAICNSKFTGGTMMMAPNADTADGKVDVVHVGALGRIGLLRAFPKIFEGKHLELDTVRGSQPSRVEFELDGPTNIMLDGEALYVQPKVIEVLPGALEVYA
ncbi:MAG: diacylglycerol kinase family lipid kinase [Nannocystaceae bacterium]|nr:diacylglycerol kinase family lipid kinase [Nannocystaceae bacterium]